MKFILCLLTLKRLRFTPLEFRMLNERLNSFEHIRLRFTPLEFRIQKQANQPQTKQQG